MTRGAGVYLKTEYYSRHEKQVFDFDITTDIIYTQHVLSKR